VFPRILEEITMNALRLLQLNMKPTWSRVVSAGAIGLIGLGLAGVSLQPAQAMAQADSPNVWRDDFDGESLDAEWYWVNENPSAWRLDDGHLQIDASLFPTGGENLLLRPAAQGRFTIETRVLFEPDSNYQIAGLVIYQDASNYLQLGRAFCEESAVCVGNGIYFDNIRDGGLADGNFATSTDTTGEAYLRMEVKGRKVTSFYSTDGETWQELGRHQVSASFEVNGVGLTSSQNYDNVEITAEFDYFSLSGNAQPSSPFIGEWQAIDADGGDMRLAIGGPPNGPFHITWQESYFGYCYGEAGIARGDGEISEDDPYVLEGQLLLECLTSVREPLAMEPVWHYDPATDTLTAHGGQDETDTVWHRPAHAPPPPTWVVIARPADDAVDGGSFPEGTPEGIVVSLLVLDDDHNTLWYGTTATVIPEWDPGRAWVFFSLDMDLTAGNHLWVYDGVNARELVVTALEVTEVNLRAYMVSGRAEPGSQVYVELSTGLAMLTADGDGNWAASFGNSDLGQSWAVYQLDADEDQTRVGFYIPNPTFVVFPEWEWFDGRDWPDGATVSITVEGKSECTVKKESWGGFFNGSFGEFCNVEIGDTVTFTDGVTTRTHTVRSLAITEVDKSANTVSGTAAIDEVVHVWVHEHGETEMELPVEVDGTWLADFGSMDFDLVEGMCGRSEIRDGVGNATAVDWCVPGT
jgi:regulation of enolase protein 1 (concanavalin A-like superfamily)